MSPLGMMCDRASSDALAAAEREYALAKAAFDVAQKRLIAAKQALPKKETHQQRYERLAKERHPRNMEMLKLRRAGVSVRDLAREFGLSVSGVHGALRAAELHAYLADHELR